MDAKRERYTPNDVGPSPIEWGVPRLGEVSTLITNGFVGTATPYYTDESGIPYLYGTNVRANKLDTKGIRYITKAFHVKQSKTELQAGDLLTVQSGHIGETAVVSDELEGANCHALIVTRLKQDEANPQYLSYYLNSEIGRARMKGLEVGSTILHINTKDLKKFRVLLPSLAEQKKIAQILSTWDKAITTTEQLLANSQQQKKALMQQLLTGKKRLLDKNGERFEGEWIESTLGSTSKCFSGGTPSRTRDDYYGGDIPWITSGRLNDRYIRSVAEHITVAGLKNSSAKVVKKGSILVAMYGATAGKVAINLIDGATINQAVLAFEPKKDFASVYLFYLLEKEMLKALGLVQGGQPNLNASIIKNWKVLLPPLAEQQKIAAVLSTADQEISALQHKLDALKKEKKALMQQLLTGKRRVQLTEQNSKAATYGN